MNGTPNPNPWAAIGLPATFTPTAVSWSIAKLAADPASDAETLHVLIIDTPAGRHAAAFTEQSWSALIRKMQEQSSGLTIASPLDVPRSNN